MKEKEKIILSIIKSNPWMTSEFFNDIDTEKFADSLRESADKNEGLENMLFELGICQLIETLGQQCFINKFR